MENVTINLWMQMSRRKIQQPHILHQVSMDCYYQVNNIIWTKSYEFLNYRLNEHVTTQVKHLVECSKPQYVMSDAAKEELHNMVIDMFRAKRIKEKI